MKRYLTILSGLIFLMSGCVSGNSGTGMIKTPTPKRAAGQTDVLQLAATPLPVVRVAFIGLGMRGPDAVERMTYMDGVEIVALCDIEKERVEKELKGEGRVLIRPSGTEPFIRVMVETKNAAFAKKMAQRIAKHC